MIPDIHQIREGHVWRNIQTDTLDGHSSLFGAEVKDDQIYLIRLNRSNIGTTKFKYDLKNFKKNFRVHKEDELIKDLKLKLKILTFLNSGPGTLDEFKAMLVELDI